MARTSLTTKTPRAPRATTSAANTTGTRRVKRRGGPLPDAAFIPVERLEDIPVFENEDEEHAFWSTHDMAGALVEEMKPAPLDGDDWLPPVSAAAFMRTRPVSVRLDQDVLRRLKALAAKKHKGYQSLLKEFVVERLYEEEKREGLLAPSGAAR